jgi:hypothetical protein
MDELLVMMKSLIEKVGNLETALEELKEHQRPLASKDYIHSLKNEEAKELDEWLQGIKISVKDIRVLLEEKTYFHILRNIKCKTSLRIFDTHKNTVYCFVDGKWKTMTKGNIEKLQTTLFNKIHKEFTAMKKGDHSDLKHDGIKELTYIEQRGIINLITTTTHTKLKKQLYDTLKEDQLEN